MGKHCDRTFEALARACWEQRITQGDFFRMTGDLMRKLGTRLMQRWRAPPAVDLEDVVQELRIGCVFAFKRYDPSHPRAPEVSAFVLFNACDKAKKWLHRQRGAKLHNPDFEPSRYALLFQDVADRRSGGRGERDEGSLEWVAEGLKADAELAADALLEEIEAMFHKPERVRRRLEIIQRHIYEAPTVRIRWGLWALKECDGDGEMASEWLYEHEGARLHLHLGSERAAMHVVMEAARHLAATREVA